MDRLSEEIIALERSALDRWITFDPQGYLDLYAPEVAYFDPNQERRVDGLEAMKALLAPIKNLKGAITDPRYEMIAPKVQRHGDVALAKMTQHMSERSRRNAESPNPPLDPTAERRGGSAAHRWQRMNHDW